MSSSSSEDDARFREACDPTLSLVFEKKKTCDKRETVEERERDDEVRDERETFLLLKRIQKSLTSLNTARENGYGLVGAKVRGEVSSSARRNTHGGGADVPSPFSSYLAKQLTGILEKNVEITETPNDGHDRANDAQKPLQLLKNIIIENAVEENGGTTEKRKKKGEVISRCLSLAVSPQWIKDKRDDYPWPHPKNIRYLEKYTVKERKEDGVMVLRACDDTSHEHQVETLGATHVINTNCIGVNGGSDCTKDVQCTAEISDTGQDNTHKKKKKKCVLPSHKVDVKTGLTTHQEVSECCEKKMRKQSRRRGKKKCKNTDSEVLSV
ncbi:hypothetical protein Hamer_G018775, partial [Homarus americanus]